MPPIAPKGPKPTVDLFSLLAGTGAKFDKSRFRSDMQLFQAKAPSTSTSSASKKKSSAKPETEASLAPELDFFQSAAAPPKTLPEKAARQSDGGDYIEDDSDAEDDDDAPEDDDENSEETLSAAKRRRNDDDDEEDEDDDEDVVLESEKDAKEFRKNHKISVLGSDVPFPFTTYKSLCERYQFPDYLQKNLTSQNYTKPTPIQMQSIPIMLHEREVIACAPTGSGKTLAFLVPILFSLGAPKGDGFRAVIISPTRELALQIHRHIKNLTQGRKFKTCVLTKSNMSSDPNQIAQLAKFDILVTTPMRLVHALDHDQIKLDKCRHLILDEADKLLELGFLTQMDSVFAACTSPHLQRSLFSATMPSGIESLARTFMRDPIRVIIGTANTATSTITQKLTYVGDESGKLIEIRQMVQSGNLKPPSLIFVQSIERAKELFQELVYDGINVDVIHSERTKAQRDAVIKNFRSGKTWVLICTDLMSRGIDFKGVSMVINYDFPQSVQSYIHRIGRTGRAGREGSAITFFTKGDSEYLRIVVNVMKESGCEVPDWMLDLKNPGTKDRRKLKSNAIDRATINTTAAVDGSLK
ncbi:P-loop containing nucleoside triphosphate hydrolase protein [Rhizoclosmatium globosum]|uniref:RNA helicase n=1 Tax=Rhizoclosmatium globosum TaxID=329046 RepID=A0A1Y2D0X1_9FUNG|nr:P-loop containing nucleoside triphosphate hydrolase protein [Rhizoclosmatium globosum]|eukprot:ORY52922.1 P-loop containing nucleoside triphosphate hydrolase protein [Rhizoclosmatium globosum]